MASNVINANQFDAQNVDDVKHFSNVIKPIWNLNKTMEKMNQIACKLNKFFGIPIKNDEN